MQAAGLYGDFEAPGAFERALKERSAGGEVILTVTDWRHQRWGHNLLLNLEALDLHHHLVLATEAHVCVSLAYRMRGDLGCGYSSWLRRGTNATIDRGLRAYRIRDEHVYHIWWQRWHYMARAVGLGYRALSLDTDLSLRVDPYRILRGGLRHNQLVVAIDSVRSGRQLARFFPAINVGFVYCRDTPGGGAHRALMEAARRFEHTLLEAGTNLSPLLEEKKQQVLWEQDTFADVIETAAFGLTGVEAHRHTLSWTWPSRRNATIEEGAFSRDWRHIGHTRFLEGVEEDERVELALPSEDAPTPLLVTAESSEASGDASSRIRPSPATVAGLPKWYLSAFASCPYGNTCNGRWARHPTPIGIAHMVGERGKFLLMRIFGWWDYSADRVPFVPVRSVSSPGSPERANGLPANGALPANAAATLEAASRGDDTAIPPRRATVFPAPMRVLVLRGTWKALSIGVGGATTPAELVATIARWAMTALALGRRLILPLVSCSLVKKRNMILHKPLNAIASVIALDAREMCDGKSDHPEWVIPPASPLHAASPRPREPEDPAGISVGQRLRAGARAEPNDAGCCALLPRISSKCIDEFGTKRMLHEELILLERDLHHMLSELGVEARPLRPGGPPFAAATSVRPDVRQIVTLAAVGLAESSNASARARGSARLKPTLPPASLLDSLRSSARILVADLRGFNAQLPTTRDLEAAALRSDAFHWLASGENMSSPVESAFGATPASNMEHAKGCLQALARLDEMVAKQAAVKTFGRKESKRSTQKTWRVRTG